jgi:polysaccharide biosynthesis protein PslH
MRILAFYPYVPYPLDRGAYYRGFHLLRELARVHDVDLLALSEKGEGLAHRQVFTEFCHRVELVPFHHPPWARLFPTRLLNPLPSTVAHWTLPQVRTALDRMLATESYDAVHVFDIILAQYLAQSRIPLIVDRTRVDLQYQLMERRHMRFSAKTRVLNLENLCKLWRYERRVAARTCLQVVCGPDDETFIRRHISRRVPVVAIPNGVDVTYFHPEASPGDCRAANPTLLFCGAMDYNPNIDALRWYFASIHDQLAARFPDLRLLIVGKDPVPEVRAYGTRSNVVVTGAVPDVRPFYRRAWLQIVPLRIGGGTRLKIVESMAMGTPAISTTIGAQGLNLQHGHDILLADSATALAADTIRALEDSALRSSLEAHGLETVCTRLSWPMLGRQLTDVYAQHVSPLIPAFRNASLDAKRGKPLLAPAGDQR